jgi:phosphonate degradation associated HDIG domain protein
MSPTPAQVADRILSLFRDKGDAAYLGEPVSQTEHAIQTAAVAESRGASPTLVVAALLHDLGHLVHGMADDAADHGIDTVHEEAGARWLAQWFPPEVTEPVRLHVAAKRYLCAVEPDYLARLSPASVHSLDLQGGPLSADEVAVFEATPHAMDAVEVRRCDDIGKCPDLAIAAVEHYRAMIASCVRPA